MKYIVMIFSITAFAFLLISCKKDYDYLPVVAEVDLERYAGKWYEIARLPNRFERGLKCVTAEYTLNSDGTIAVLNQGHKESDPSKIKQAKGKAKLPDDKVPAKLSVSFFGPFYGDYWILDLSEDYSYALVGHPNRKYLWILARTSSLPNDIISKLLTKADKLGFATDEVIRVAQDCD